MRNLSLIDTHCDTAFELYHRGQDIQRNNCHISLDGAAIYKNYAQLFAVWADRRRTDDECFEDFLRISDNLKFEVQKHSDSISLVSDFKGMQGAWEGGKSAAFLAVEDARILGGRLERLDILAERDVKYLTLLWGGKTSIGSSHDAEGGLTDFGIDVVRRCFDLGILPDVSHANEQVTDEVAEMALEYGKPFIASHSNCYEVFPHTRNLRKKHLDTIIKLGGVVGISLCTHHLRDMRDGGICTAEDVFAHIEGYMEAGAMDVLGLGCDLDGTDLPYGFSGVGDLYKIADICLSHGYSDELVDKIFYKNHYEFIKRTF